MDRHVELLCQKYVGAMLPRAACRVQVTSCAVGVSHDDGAMIAPQGWPGAIGLQYGELGEKYICWGSQFEF